MDWIAILRIVAPLVAKPLIEQVQSRLNQTELKEALLRALEVTVQTHEMQTDPAKMLFLRCDDKQKQNFLEKALKHQGVLNELKKPLEEKGTPDVDCLVKVLEQVEQEQKIQLNSTILKPWLETFSRSYFEQTSAYIAKFQAAQENYLKQVANWFDDVKFAGMAVEGQEVDKADKLVSIFVMPDVQKRDRFFDSARFDEMPGLFDDVGSRQAALLYEQRSRASFDRTGRKFLAQQLLQQNRSKVVILGAPGSGKTTLLRYFAVKLAIGEATDLGLKDGDWLPILIPIRDWALRPELGVLEFVRWFAEKRMTVKGVPTGFFEYWLDRGRALILLDGLDEVADEGKRYDMVQRIENFLGQYDQNRAIVSSRPAGYKQDFFRTEEFPNYDLLAFNDAKVEEFIQHWYDSRIKDPAEADRKKDSLRKALDQHDRIKVLARNPLLLTIVALIHRYQARLPRERFRLYDIAVKTLIESWDSNKELTEKTVLKYLDLSDLRRLMEGLAYWIHTQGSTGDTEGGTLIDKDELLEWLSKEIRKQKQLELYQAKDEAKQFLKFVRERTGLLNEHGQDCYAFVHKTFQEYLCAQEIDYRADNEDEFEIVLAHIRQHLHDQHWREVLLLLIAQQKPKKVAKAIRAVLEHQSQYEQWLHRDLFFAGECLAEDPKDLKGVDKALVEEILDKLVTLEVSRSPQVISRIQERVFETLCRLSESAFENDILEKLKAQAEQIGEIRLRQYQFELGESEEALSRLLKLLKDEESWARSNAAAALGKLGTTTGPVVTELLKLLKDEDSAVRFMAADALGKLGTTTDPVITELLKLLKDEDFSVCFGAADALGKLGTTTGPVVTELLKLLKDRDSWTRESAADALGKLGTTTDPVITELLKLLKDEESWVRFRAAAALGKLGVDSDPVITELLKLLKDEDFSVRSSVAAALGKLGVDLDPVVTELLKLLKDERFWVRESAAAALGNLGVDSDPVVTELLKLLKDEDFSVCFSAAAALGNLGVDSDPVVTELLKLLKDRDSWTRESAADALGKLGTTTDPVITELLKLLKDEDCSVRSSVAAALGKLGKCDQSIEPRIAQWIEQNQDSENIEYGIEALWQIVEE
ncbi:HEAT repeat domain-containing protein [Leptolyngbya sp. FACHB-17]|uniref:HEAT repeat domain-containing protein n=1 Tax=unclassified Leptolyngbya TaxID=2650499 RepID=UPI00168124C9|nr:HEAT repeat domain-containing protein [Leptolyngbya sp. FACHB-17]MBD2079967.1 HEAT repeat domain-containing protein [Leptolyngbya sp. FACHB-17]